MRFQDYIDAQEHKQDERQGKQTPPYANGHRNGSAGYAQAALTRELEALAATGEGTRNDQLNKAAFNLGQLVAGGELPQTTVIDELVRVARNIGLPEKEIERTIRSGLAGGSEQPRATPPRSESTATTIQGGGKATAGSALPEEFWEARPVLAHIRQAAWSRGRPAESVLGAALARIAADTHHAVKLPPTVGAPCGLSLITCLSGPPGTGKSSSKGIATELVPPRLIEPNCDDVPPGSGEGIIELLFDLVTEDGPDGKKTRVKRQTRHNVFTYTDEGELLANQARRGTVSTILPTLRSVFTDGTLGQANASEERKRVVPGGKYVYGIIVALQPDKAATLFEDAGGGTPQRFLWFATNTPVPPPGERPPWPGPLLRPDPKQIYVRSVSGWSYLELPEAVVTEIQANDHHKQQHGCDPLDEHADLLRLKVAAVLAILDNRNGVNTEDWELAGLVREASNATRDAALAVLATQREQQAEAQRDRRSREAVAVDEAVAKRRVVDVARKIARKVHKEPDRWKVSELRRWIGRDRDVFSDALDHAVDESWVVEEQQWIEGSRGSGEVRLLRPGGRQP